MCTSSLLAATAFPASRGMQMAAVGPPLRGPERLCARVRLPSDFSGRCVRPPSQLPCVWAMLSHRPTPPAAACLLSLAYIARSTPPRTPRRHASARQCSRGAAPDRHHHRPLLAHRAQLLLRLMHPKAPRGWLSCVVVGLGFSPRLHCAAGAVRPSGEGCRRPQPGCRAAMSARTRALLSTAFHTAHARSRYSAAWWALPNASCTLYERREWSRGGVCDFDTDDV